jgi:Mce-associated membrane protein
MSHAEALALTDAVDEDIAPDTATDLAPPPGGGRLRRILLAAAVAGFLAVSGALGYTLYQQSELHRLHAAAVSTSHDYLVAMASFDYRDLDTSKPIITDRSTADFAKKYDEMVTALRDIVVTGKGVATATVEHVAVQRLDESSATVIGFVDQQVANVTAPEGNQQRYRMVVTLVRAGDHWSVDNVETV